MTDEIMKALFSYLSLLTIFGAMFVPSVFISAALGVSVGMIGAVALNGGQSDSQIVIAWLIAQTGVAVIITFISRRVR